MIYIYKDLGVLSEVVLSFEKKENILIDLNLKKYQNIMKRTKSLRRIPIFKNYFYKKKIENFIKNLDILNEKDNVMIFFDCSPLVENLDVLKRIRKAYPNLKMVLWYWNSINFWQSNPERKGFIGEFEKIFNKIVTFNLEDSKKYGYKYQNQFYSESIVKNKTIEQGIKLEGRKGLFIGRDKGRLDIIKKIKNKLDEKKIELNIYIVKDIDKDYSKEIQLKECLHSKEKNYYDVIEDIKKVDFLLDIVPIKESGITLRVLESLFFEKKLITNNKSVLELNFYNSENIYYFEKIEDFSLTEEFFSKPYVKVEKEKIEEYKNTTWLREIIK